MAQPPDPRAEPAPGPDASERTIEADPRRIWAVLEDTTLLPRLVPGVTAAPAAREHLGAERSCAVTMAGRSGEVVERCTAFEPHRRIAWRMLGDTMGITRHYAHFGFGFELAEVAPGRTRVVCRGDYRPKGPLAGLMHALVMRGKFRRLREEVLANLDQLAGEARAAPVPGAARGAAGGAAGLRAARGP